MSLRSFLLLFAGLLVLPFGPAQAESAPVRQTRPRKPSVAKAVAKAIEASPVGKAGAVTSAMLGTRRAGLLSRRVHNKHVVVTGATAVDALDLAAIRDLGGDDVPVLLCDLRGEVIASVPSGSGA